jgi:two-component system CheB/CheR fusion protein
VTLHGGQVAAFSEGPGTGSEFVVRLPLAPDEAAASDGERPDPVAADRRMRVLVVDDQPDLAESVAMLIETLGHEATAVSDGDAALRIGRSALPDVMFVDIGMPRMNGFELARQVRLDPKLSHVRLVALTGYGRDEDRARVMEAGFDLHITKPIADAQLREALADLAPRPVE